MSDEPTEESEQETAGQSAGARIVSWLVAVVILVVVLLAFMHVFAPAIGRDEEPPAEHWQSACIACHLVTTTTGADRE